MPIFEYQCKSCNTKYEVFHKSSLKQGVVSCPECNSNEGRKLFSTFSASVSNTGNYPGSCSSGNCDIPSAGGCTSGMCGLN